jgi:4-amino-4-deoxy-L-arabinose transferase-like glycosyltransferase
VTSHTSELTVAESHAPTATEDSAHNDHHAPEVDPPAHVYTQGLAFGLAMLAGGSLTLSIVMVCVGAFFSAGSDTSLIGILFVLGLLGFIGGSAAWVGYVQPYKHFDDITVPLYHGHAHDEHHEAAHDEAAEHAAQSAHH